MYLPHNMTTNIKFNLIITKYIVKHFKTLKIDQYNLIFFNLKWQVNSQHCGHRKELIYHSGMYVDLVIRMCDIVDKISCKKVEHSLIKWFVVHFWALYIYMYTICIWISQIDHVASKSRVMTVISLKVQMAV